MASKSLTRIQEFVKRISESFKIKNMGKLHYFLGVKITYPESGKIWLGQLSYTAEVLKRFQMENSKSSATPTNAGTRLTKTTEKKQAIQLRIVSIGHWNSAISTRTRPDIAMLSAM